MVAKINKGFFVSEVLDPLDGVDEDVGQIGSLSVVRYNIYIYICTAFARDIGLAELIRSMDDGIPDTGFKLEIMNMCAHDSPRTPSQRDMSGRVPIIWLAAHRNQPV